MKKLLIFSILAITAMVANAAPQTYTAPIQRKKQVKTEPPPPISNRDVQGVIPRAVRGGNPLQMLNPKAPARYGTAEQSVVFEPYTGKWKGIKLFEILF
jgi:hypothetical protein